MKGSPCTVEIIFLLQVCPYPNPFPSSILTFLHFKLDLVSSLYPSIAHCHLSAPVHGVYGPGHAVQSPWSSGICLLSRLISPCFSPYAPYFSGAGLFLVAGMCQNDFHWLHSYSHAVIWAGWSSTPHPITRRPIYWWWWRKRREREKKWKIKIITNYCNRLLKRMAFPLLRNSTTIHNPKLQVLHVPTF